MTATDAMQIMRSALDAKGCHPKVRGDAIEALCPAHDDSTASLSVRRGVAQPVVVHCHAGCASEAVLGALGLSWGDVCESNGKRSAARPEIVDVYRYDDETGRPLFEVVRFSPKGFRQRRPDGTWSVNGVRRVPYRLPGVLAAAAAGETVWIAEGEKDVQALERAGVVATCNPGGAGKWRDEYGEPLRGASVVVVADRDDAGRAHARDVLSKLAPYAIEAVVVEPGGDHPAKDAAEHFGRGGTLDDFVEAPEIMAPPAGTDLGEPESVGEFALTDLGNARRLVADHGHDLRYAPQLGTWLAWDGARWREDITGEVHRRAKTVADDLLRDAERARTVDEQKALAKHWLRSQHAARLAAMVTVAATEPGVAVTVDQLDADPWAFNVGNGTVDLRTGELRPHRRGDLLTKMTPVPFDPVAEAPTWLRFLDSIFAGDHEVIAFVQALVGYSITGDVSEQKLPVAYGPGGNGKSTFLGAMKSALGDYATSIDPQVLVASDHVQHPTGLMGLRGARFVSTVETEQGQRLAEALVKKLTGGDPIDARRMRENYVSFMPTHKLWLAANYLPRVRGTDFAIWRRLVVVPFLVTFDDRHADKALPQKLAAEAPGILAWCVEGCRRWQRDGLVVPLRVRTATEHYRSQEDHVGRFLAECCITDDDRSVPAALLRERYESWCEAEGERPWSAKSVGAELSKRGLDRVQCGSAKTWTWIGIDLPSSKGHVS